MDLQKPKQKWESEYVIFFITFVGLVNVYQTSGKVKTTANFKIIQKAAVHENAQEMEKAILYYFKQADKKKNNIIFTIIAGMWLRANQSPLSQE